MDRLKEDMIERLVLVEEQLYTAKALCRASSNILQGVKGQNPDLDVLKRFNASLDEIGEALHMMETEIRDFVRDSKNSNS